MSNKKSQSDKPRKRSPNTPPQGDELIIRPSRNSSADLIHKDLHDKIVKMKLAPGDPLSEGSLATNYEVSRTPVREALFRLAEEKLVEVVPRSGTFVARIPLSALPEIIVIRKALETVTARAAAISASASDIQKMRKNVQLQKRLMEKGDADLFQEADEAFHAAIAAAGEHPGIWDLILEKKIQIDRCRRMTLPKKGRMELAMKEHEAVLDAIEARAPARAAMAMETHLSHFLIDIPSFLESHPNYFVQDIDMEQDFIRRSKV